MTNIYSQQPILHAQNLCVAIDSTEILHRLNFSVASGEFLAIRGANGSGKTTLIRTVLNMLAPTEGKLTLFGTNTTGLRSGDWRKIGYAPQRVTATATMPATALETVASGLLYGNRLWKPRDWKAKAIQALKLVGLEHRANESIQTFSGGQQQRVLIARAMVKQPQLLIFDEPFAGVDASTRYEIADILANMRENGTTIIAVLHDIYELEPLIDTTLFLENGRIVNIEHTNFEPIDTADKPSWQPHPPYDADPVVPTSLRIENSWHPPYDADPVTENSDSSALAPDEIRNNSIHTKQGESYQSCMQTLNHESEKANIHTAETKGTN